MKSYTQLFEEQRRHIQAYIKTGYNQLMKLLI